MNRFAFMIHPLSVDDISRKFGFARRLPEGLQEKLLLLLPPIKISEIKNISSIYAETEGWFVACPLTTRQMVTMSEDYVIKKIIKTGKMAEKLGADILGLGAMTSVVGDAGITIAKNLNIPVTTGNSYTVAVAMRGVKKAAEIMEIDLKNAEVAVVGATGSIGSVCAQMIAKDCGHLTLIARNKERLQNLASKIKEKYGVEPEVTSDLKKALPLADVVITVTSAVDTVIEPQDLKVGAVVCDVARPRDVSKKVTEERDDVLVIEGGLVEVPGNPEFNFNFGYPPGIALACMAETMILALEGRLESYTLGRELSVEKVEEIDYLGEKHGFKLAGFRSFERPVEPETIEKIKRKAMLKKQKRSSLSFIS